MPDVTLPRLADTLVEGTVTRWLKSRGDHVARGEPLVEIETDKVNTELESPFEGVLEEIVAPEGATIPVGDVIARIGNSGAPAADPAVPAAGASGEAASGAAASPAGGGGGPAPIRRRMPERRQEARACATTRAAMTRLRPRTA